MARAIAIAEVEDFCEVDLSVFCEECLERVLHISLYATRDDSATLELEVTASFDKDLYLELLDEDEDDPDDDPEDADDPDPVLPVMEPQTT